MFTVQFLVGFCLFTWLLGTEVKLRLYQLWVCMSASWFSFLIHFYSVGPYPWVQPVMPILWLEWGGHLEVPSSCVLEVFQCIGRSHEAPPTLLKTSWMVLKGISYLQTQPPPLPCCGFHYLWNLLSVGRGSLGTDSPQILRAFLLLYIQPNPVPTYCGHSTSSASSSWLNRLPPSWIW